MNRPIPTISLDTQRLIKCLDAVTPAAPVVPYESLSSLIGRDVRGEAMHLLASARQFQLRRKSKLFVCVRGVGVKLATDPERVDAGRADLKGIRRRAARGATKLASVQNYAALPREQQVQHNTAMSQLGAVAHFASARSEKRIAAQVSQQGEEMNLPALLELMGKEKPKGDA